MSAIEREGLHHLFELLAEQGGDALVRIAIFEISGKKCFDLLQNGHREVLLKVRSTHPRKKKPCLAKSSKHFCEKPFRL
jgi:hypothetical protein